MTEKPIERLDAFERIMQGMIRKTSESFTALQKQLKELIDWISIDDFLQYYKTGTQLVRRIELFINNYLAIEHHIANISTVIQQQRDIIPDQYYGRLYGSIATFYSQVKQDLINNAHRMKAFVEQLEAAWSQATETTDREAQRRAVDGLAEATRKYLEGMENHVRGVARVVLSFYSREFKQYRNIRNFYIDKHKN